MILFGNVMYVVRPLAWLTGLAIHVRVLPLQAVLTWMIIR